MHRVLKNAIIAACMLQASAAFASTPLVLGFTTSKSGPWATFTKRNEIAVQMAIEDINKSGGVNGHQLVMKEFDTAGKPDQAAIATRQFAENDGALAVVGPFSSSECRIAFPVGERLGIVQMAIASAAPGLSAPFKFAFRNTSDEGYLFERLMNVLRSNSIPSSSASIAYATDEVVAKSLGEGVFPKVLAKDGVSVKKTVTFNSSAFDLSAQVSQLKADSTDLLAIGAPPEATVALIKELRRQGIKARVVAGTPSMDFNIAGRLGANAEGLTASSTFYPDDDRPEVKAFRDEFIRRAKAAKEIGDLRPNMYDAAAYTIVHLYAEAMRRGNVTGDPSKLAAERVSIRDQLRQLKNVPTVEGKLVRFTETNDALKTVYILQVHDGKWILLGSRGPGDLK